MNMCEYACKRVALHSVKSEKEKIFKTLDTVQYSIDSAGLSFPVTTKNVRFDEGYIMNDDRGCTNLHADVALSSSVIYKVIEGAVARRHCSRSH